MGIPQDPKEQRAWMLDLLIHHYGIRGHVIDPANHLSLNDLPKPDEPAKKTRKPDARMLKSNERLYELIAYFQREYGLFQEGIFDIDCPIHQWFGKTAKEDWVYAGVFRIIPREHGYIAFTCNESGRCQWQWCPVNRSVPFAKQRLDPFDLLQILDSIKRGYHYPQKYGNVADYAAQLGQALGVATKKLRAEGTSSSKGLGRGRGKRFPCDKNQLLNEIMSNVPRNDADVEAFVDKICGLIYKQQPEWVFDKTQSSNTVWLPDSAQNTLRKVGAAVRLWLYLWIRQQQERGRVVANVEEFATALGVSAKAIYRHRALLEKAKKLTKRKAASGGRTVETWTVKP